MSWFLFAMIQSALVTVGATLALVVRCRAQPGEATGDPGPATVVLPPALVPSEQQRQSRVMDLAQEVELLRGANELLRQRLGKAEDDCAELKRENASLAEALGRVPVTAAASEATPERWLERVH